MRITKALLLLSCIAVASTVQAQDYVCGNCVGAYFFQGRWPYLSSPSAKIFTKSIPIAWNDPECHDLLKFRLEDAARFWVNPSKIDLWYWMPYFAFTLETSLDPPLVTAEDGQNNIFFGDAALSNDGNAAYAVFAHYIDPNDSRNWHWYEYDMVYDMIGTQPWIKLPEDNLPSACSQCVDDATPPVHYDTYWAAIHEFGHAHGIRNIVCLHPPEDQTVMSHFPSVPQPLYERTCLEQPYTFPTDCDFEAMNAYWNIPTPVYSVTNLQANPTSVEGEINITWEADGEESGGLEDQMWVQRSTDGGVTFDPPGIGYREYQNGVHDYDYTDRNLIVEGLHYYRIWVRSTTGETLILTDPVSATPYFASPNPPPPVQPPGETVFETDPFSSDGVIAVVSGSEYVEDHKVEWGGSPSLGQAAILEPGSSGVSFDGVVGQVYYAATRGRRSPTEVSPLNDIVSFMAPVIHFNQLENGDFEAGQFGWHPWLCDTCVEIQSGTGSAEYGFNPSIPITGAGSAFVNSSAGVSGEARWEVRYMSSLARIDQLDAHAVKLSYRGRYDLDEGHPINEASWRLSARIVQLGYALEEITATTDLVVQQGDNSGTGASQGDTGVVEEWIPVGEIDPGAAYLRVEIDLRADAVGRSGGADATVLVDDVELVTVDLLQSSVACRLEGGTANSELLVGGCPWNGNATGHPCGTSSFCGDPGDYWIEVELLDPAGQGIADFSELSLDLSACSSVQHYLGPLGVVLPDAPTDATGKTMFRSGLNFGGAEDCTYSLLVGGTTWMTGSGLRNMDISGGDGKLALGDLSDWQQAFVVCSEYSNPEDCPERYQCDLTLDEICALGDLSNWQSHFTYGSGIHSNPPSQGIRQGPARVAQDVAGPTTDPSAVGSADPRMYLHVTDRAPEGTIPPPVGPGQANAAVGSVGPNGRDITIWLYAADYSELAGIHAKFRWPRGWRLAAVEDELLPGQVFGYAEGYHGRREAYMTAFDCVTDGEPVAIGRFDVHADRPGSVDFLRENSLIRIVDCRGTVRDIGTTGTEPRSGPQASPSATAVPPETSLTRVSPVASPTGGEFVLALETPTTVTVRVYDVAGRVVKTLVNGVALEASTHSLVWDGSVDRGGRVASGVYFLDVRAGDKHFLERMVLVR